MKTLFEGKRKLWLFCGFVLAFLSSCGEGRLADIGLSGDSEGRYGEEVSEQRGERLSNDGMRVKGAPVVSSKAKEVVSWRSTSGVSSKAALDSHALTVVTFNPLPESALRELQEENRRNSDKGFGAKALRIGVNRKANTEMSNTTPFALNWQRIEDGALAKIAITSPGASRIRVALQLHALPDDAKFRFSGSGEPEKIIGVISLPQATMC